MPSATTTIGRLACPRDVPGDRVGDRPRQRLVGCGGESPSSHSGHEPAYTIWSGVSGPASTSARPSGVPATQARIGRPVEHDAARDAVHAERIAHGARQSLDHRRGCRRRRGVVRVDDASRSAPGRRRRPPPTARRSRPPRRPPRSARGSGAASPRPGSPGARPASRRRAISRASGSPGSVYGIHRTWSPNRSRAIASPSRAQVRALTVVGWVWITNRRGMSAWNTHSTDGRRVALIPAPRGHRDAHHGVAAGLGLARGPPRGPAAGPSPAASATPAVIDASETPLGLMYSVAAVLDGAVAAARAGVLRVLPEPPRQPGGRRRADPPRVAAASTIIVARTAARSWRRRGSRRPRGPPSRGSTRPMAGRRPPRARCACRPGSAGSRPG